MLAAARPGGFLANIAGNFRTHIVAPNFREQCTSDDGENCRLPLSMLFGVAARQSLGVALSVSKKILFAAGWNLRNRSVVGIRQTISYFSKSILLKISADNSQIRNSLYEFSYEYLRNRAKKNPISFNDKIIFRMAYDRNPIFPILADKLAVRNYVKDCVGEEYLIPTLAVTDAPRLIDWEKLPNEFVCKVNHGSGGLIGVHFGVENEASLPSNFDLLKWQRYWVNPEKFNQSSASGMLSKWMSMNYEWQAGRSPEWAYKNIKPAIIIEKLLMNDNSTIALQTQLYVFNGRVRLIRIAGRNKDGSRTMTYFTPSWEFLPVGYTDGNKFLQPNPLIKKPKLLPELVSIAEALASNLDFARVDLFDLGNEVKFGEITIYPSAGEGFWSPRDFSFELGSYWDLDLSMRERNHA